MKIVFHTPSIDVRGTCVSLYDYAHYNEIILGGRSVILTRKDLDHEEEALYKFAKRFEIRFYTDPSKIDETIDDCDIFYTLKYGKPDDNIISKTKKSCIHCVFDLSTPHGHVYAAVSDTLAKKFGHDKYVPHMISLSPSIRGENMRNSLKIPENAIVFGRHGGRDTFDLNFVMKVIQKIVQETENIYYIFVNTPCFYKHDRIIHLDKIADTDEINRFIMSCDAMIHAQSLGETFGIAIGEFSINNKPIIAYNGNVWNDHYKNILKDKALWYVTEDECYKQMINFDPTFYKDKDMNCYKEYSPEKVMKKFKEVFIDG